MRFLRQVRYAFGPGFSLRRASRMFVGVMLIHLALVPMKIEFVYSRRPDFESLDVSRLIFHDYSFHNRALDTQNSAFV